MEKTAAYSRLGRRFAPPTFRTAPATEADSDEFIWNTTTEESVTALPLHLQVFTKYGHH